MATEIPILVLGSLGQGLHPLPSAGVLNSDGFAGGLDHMGTVEQSVDMGGGQTGRHALVKARSVRSSRLSSSEASRPPLFSVPKHSPECPKPTRPSLDLQVGRERRVSRHTRRRLPCRYGLQWIPG